MSFVADFTQGWVWSWRRKRIPAIIISACLFNFGLTGVGITIQLHLVSDGTAPVRIGLIDTGICAAMLIGSVAANVLSGRLHTGKAVCAGYLFMLVAIVPVMFTSNYWVMLVCYALVGLPVPLVNAMMLGFVFSKTDESMQGRVQTAISTPVQVLAMFCGGIAGMLLPVAGFALTAGIFIVGIAAGTLVVLISPAIRAIPEAGEWNTTEL